MVIKVRNIIANVAKTTKKYKGEYDETKGTSLSKKGKSTIRKERSSLFLVCWIYIENRVCLNLKKWQLTFETPSWHFKRRRKVVPPWYQTGVVNEAGYCYPLTNHPVKFLFTFWNFCVRANWNLFSVWNRLKLWRCETHLWVLNLHLLISRCFQ